MDNNEQITTNEGDMGLNKAELEAFFKHLGSFCAECNGVPLGRNVESCKRPGCVLYPIRLVYKNLKYRPETLDKFLLQKRRPPIADKHVHDNRITL